MSSPQYRSGSRRLPDRRTSPRSSHTRFSLSQKDTGQSHEGVHDHGDAADARTADAGGVWTRRLWQPQPPAGHPGRQQSVDSRGGALGAYLGDIVSGIIYAINATKSYESDPRIILIEFRFTFLYRIPRFSDSLLLSLSLSGNEKLQYPVEELQVEGRVGRL